MTYSVWSQTSLIHETSETSFVEWGRGRVHLRSGSIQWVGREVVSESRWCPGTMKPWVGPWNGKLDTSDRRISVRSGIFAAQADLKVRIWFWKRQYTEKNTEKTNTIEITARLESFDILKLYLLERSSMNQSSYSRYVWSRLRGIHRSAS